MGNFIPSNSHPTTHSTQDWLCVWPCVVLYPPTVSTTPPLLCSPPPCYALKEKIVCLCDAVLELSSSFSRDTRRQGPPEKAFVCSFFVCCICTAAAKSKVSPFHKTFTRLDSNSLLLFPPFSSRCFRLRHRVYVFWPFLFEGEIKNISIEVCVVHAFF